MSHSVLRPVVRDANPLPLPRLCARIPHSFKVGNTHWKHRRLWRQRGQPSYYQSSPIAKADGSRHERSRNSTQKHCESAVHFIGIGGSGLSALAALAAKQGFCVFGSDAVEGEQLQRLREAGIFPCVGHNVENLDGLLKCPAASKAVVKSSAVPDDNVEVQRARELDISVLKRDQWLGTLTQSFDLIAVAGTHGKTSTTSMLAWALTAAHEEPIAAIVGSNVPQFPGGGNVLFEDSARLMVLEADEYDNCFLALSPSVAVVTNVEWEHVDFFPNEAAVKASFTRFVERLRPNGTLVLCGDNAGSKALASAFAQKTQSADQTKSSANSSNSNISSSSSATTTTSSSSSSNDSSSQSSGRAGWLDVGEDTRKVVTYGLDKGNDWQAIMLSPNTVGGTDYVAVVNNRPMARVSLRLPGIHNVLNSLAALAATAVLAARDAPSAGDWDKVSAVGLEIQRLAVSRAAAALCDFRGAARRFQLVGRAVERRALVIDDYAHHPTEVRAVLQAARQRFDTQPIWVVFQPHTHSRLACLLDDFAPAFSAADRVIVTKVYAARKEGDVSITGEDLVACITGPPATYIAELDAVVDRLAWEICAQHPIDEDEPFSSLSSSLSSSPTRSSIPSSWYLSQAATIDDIVVLTLGAGDITTVGPALLQALSKTSQVITEHAS